MKNANGGRKIHFRMAANYGVGCRFLMARSVIFLSLNLKTELSSGILAFRISRHDQSILIVFLFSLTRELKVDYQK